jgi:hypothetical protein
MKTQEEIEKSARIYANYRSDSSELAQVGSGGLYHGYKKGYNQCQEDMADKKYTEEDVINALHSVELKNNKDYSKIYEGMKEYLHSLNKQD